MRVAKRLDSHPPCVECYAPSALGPPAQCKRRSPSSNSLARRNEVSGAASGPSERGWSAVAATRCGCGVGIVMGHWQDDEPGALEVGARRSSSVVMLNSEWFAAQWSIRTPRNRLQSVLLVPRLESTRRVGYSVRERAFVTSGRALQRPG
ncbi:hypothetical protein BD626DRAFT_488736 [Schizophyllum amplum]|uniref:Uncharacterized protein n=1 Tax=Schizophyllum amplum TaxID=97359 RepID=A0A550CKT3_9AGAR|nr:hypothetical protein BD626DRAFT_488736 [Auriculariopsis ampla]